MRNRKKFSNNFTTTRLNEVSEEDAKEFLHAPSAIDQNRLTFAEHME